MFRLVTVLLDVIIGLKTNVASFGIANFSTHSKVLTEGHHNLHPGIKRVQKLTLNQHNVNFESEPLVKNSVG